MSHTSPSCASRLSGSTTRSITCTRPAIPCTSSGGTRSQTIARLSASARRAWHSDGWPACCTRLSRSWRSWAAGPRHSCAGSILRRTGAGSRPLVHRWIRGSDLAALVLILQRMLRESGSIERFFLAGDVAEAPDVGPGLEAFSTRALATDVRPAYGRVPKHPGVCSFFPRPSAGSACKRLNLFLRWMVRKDVVDLGVWTGLSPSRLIVPLDTHVVRLGNACG